jgi:hypothetical protein
MQPVKGTFPASETLVHLLLPPPGFITRIDGKLWRQALRLCDKGNLNDPGLLNPDVAQAVLRL